MSAKSKDPNHIVGHFGAEVDGSPRPVAIPAGRLHGALRHLWGLGVLLRRVPCGGHGHRCLRGCNARGEKEGARSERSKGAKEAQKEPRDVDARSFSHGYFCDVLVRLVRDNYIV